MLPGKSEVTLVKRQSAAFSQELVGEKVIAAADDVRGYQNFVADRGVTQVRKRHN